MRDDYDLGQAKRGAILPTSGKTRITIRLDNEILGWFRGLVESEGGGSYQTKINAALREFIIQQEEPLEGLLRRVVREELRQWAQRPGPSAPGSALQPSG